MKGRDSRESIKSAPLADLLVCLPSRANLASRPKPIGVPGMPPDIGNCRHLELLLHRKRSVTRGSQASPLFWAKPKKVGSEIAEPTSPEVTCSGKIRVRASTQPCKSWQSVMEEMEKVHSSRKHKIRTWLESLSIFKKNVMQFMKCFESLKFDLRCFGTSPESKVGTDNKDEETEANYDENTSGAVFSKWFMVLQENQVPEFDRTYGTCGGMFYDDVLVAPPPNALVLMRSRSAPVKGRSVSGGDGGEENHHGNSEDRGSSDGAIREGRSRKLGWLMHQEDEERKKMEAGNLVSSPDDIATGRQVVSGMSDPFSRCRSWRW